MARSCVLMVDITGSTQLYESVANREALTLVDGMLIRMREIIEAAGGDCVKSKGDDVLSVFPDSEAGFQAAWALINEDWVGDLSVHVGVYFGDFLTHEEDIYGPAINTAARLTSLAKSGEILLGGSCFEGLSAESQAKLLMIGELALRGKNTPTRVYACSVAEMFQQTVIFAQPEAERAGRTEFAEFSLQGSEWKISEGETLTIGRSSDCDIVLEQAWVSRTHAVISLRHWQLEIKDHSSAGTVLINEGGEEVALHRRANLLSGEGVIYCGIGAAQDVETAIHFSTHTLSIQNASV